MKTYLIVAILLLTSSGLFAQKEIQKGDMNIHIKVDDNWDQTTFIDISKKSEKVIISSPKRIRLRKDELDKDTAFLNLRKNGSKYAIAEYKQKFKNFIDQHSTFDTTTVVVNLRTDHQYEEILKLITATSKAKLEKSHEIRDLLMDASDFTFTISTDSSTKNIFAKGLFKERYPMLSNFITLTYTRLESTLTK